MATMVLCHTKPEPERKLLTISSGIVTTHSSVGRALHCSCEGHVFDSRWVDSIFFAPLHIYKCFHSLIEWVDTFGKGAVMIRMVFERRWRLAVLDIQTISKI